MEVVDSVRGDAVHDTAVIAAKWVSDVGRVGVFLSSARLKALWKVSWKCARPSLLRRCRCHRLQSEGLVSNHAGASRDRSASVPGRGSIDLNHSSRPLQMIVLAKVSH